MAGIAKPNIENLGQEMTDYEIIESTVVGSGDGLFNGVVADEWNTNNVAYWQIGKNYVTVKFNKLCHIWRTGTNRWLNNCAPLAIYDADTNENVTDLFNQVVTAKKCDEWERTMTVPYCGTFKFVCNGLRIDSEWYLEKLISVPEIPNEDALITANQLAISMAYAKKYIDNKSSDSSFSGSYNDLTDKPTIPIFEIMDSLTSNSNTAALSANQGKVLNDKITDCYNAIIGAIGGKY